MAYKERPLKIESITEFRAKTRVYKLSGDIPANTSIKRTIDLPENVVGVYLYNLPEGCVFSNYQQGSGSVESLAGATSDLYIEKEGTGAVSITFVVRNVTNADISVNLYGCGMLTIP